jgi:hypothetical protein
MHMKNAMALATLGLLAAAGPALAQTVDLTTGPFRDTAALESAWRAGITTPDEVRRLVGPPNGAGSFLGVIDYRPFNIWFYDDVAVVGATAQSGTGIVNIQSRQQFLMVFFRDDRYQGHMWFSNDSRGTGWLR